MPDDFLTARCDTWIALLALRALPLRGDLNAAIRMLTSVQIYPLAKQDGPPRYSYLDRTSQAANTTPLAWEDNLEFWRVLHAVVHTAGHEELRPMLGTLAELGILAGQPFAPDERMQRVLTEAARRGRDEMLVAAFASRRPDRMVWPDRTWEWAGLRPENGSFERDGSLDVEAPTAGSRRPSWRRPAMFRRAVGQGSLYWLAHRDAAARTWTARAATG